MLTGATSFVAPLLLTTDREITWGQSNLGFYGGTRGMEYGVLVSHLLLGDDGGNIDDSEPRAFAASILLGSVAGLTGGTLWAGHARMSAGDARTVAVLGDYGLFAGLVTGHALGWDELEGEFGQPRLDDRARAMSASGLVGSALGLTSGRLLSLSRDNSWGDGEVMRAGGLLGVLAGFTTAALLDYEDSSRKSLATMVIGSGLGLALGDWLVRDTSFGVGESVLVDLSLVAGGLGATGLTYLFTESGDASLYLSAATLGAATTGGLAYYALRDREDTRATSGQTPGVALLPRIGRNGHAGVTLLGRF